MSFLFDRAPGAANPPLRAWLDRNQDNIQAAVDELAEYVQLLNIGAWGGMRVGSPITVPPWDLSDVWQKVDLFDTARPGERYVVTDLVNDSMTYTYAGMYVASIQAAARIVEQNRGRVVELRLNNLTDGVQSDPIPIGVGRNTDVININLTFMVEVEAANDEYTMEIRCPGDTIDITQWDAFLWDTWRVSPPATNLIGTV